LPFTLELTFIKQRVARRVPHEVHRSAQIWTGRREVVMHDFLARRRVVGDAELADFLKVLVGVRDGAIRLEEHVLVKMRQPVQLRRLSE